jgi:hypothetical protein
MIHCIHRREQNRILTTALSLYILVTTGSAAKFGYVIVMSIIPMLILGPISGVITDNLNRKK